MEHALFIAAPIKGRYRKFFTIELRQREQGGLGVKLEVHRTTAHGHGYVKKNQGKQAN
ncbi:hypothetical protein RTCIAT899_PB00035 (plasmid) [Rhizobium tropici CIAT 899]|nr:hypothetical protein RTCIAT899_PB00035 [Rhizobium tropici CIAT 899]